MGVLTRRTHTHTQQHQHYGQLSGVVVWRLSIPHHPLHSVPMSHSFCVCGSAFSAAARTDCEVS